MADQPPPDDVAPSGHSFLDALRAELKAKLPSRGADPVVVPPQAQSGPAFDSRFLHEIVDEPPSGFPRKTLSLVASARGTLTLRSVVVTAAGDRFDQTHALLRCDALDLITALADWVASPDSIVRENSPGAFGWDAHCVVEPRQDFVDSKGRLCVDEDGSSTTGQ